MVLIKKIDPATQPKPRNSGNVGRKGGFKSKIKKPANERKRPLDSESIYGEELFATNIKREKQIVIHFYPFTKNNLRISSCGKFVIEKIQPKMDQETKEFEFAGYRWDLFYFRIPIDDFVPPKDEIEFKEIDYCIDLTRVDTQVTFINDLELLEEKIIELVRAEFFLERQNKLQELKEQDEEERKQKDAQELAEEIVEEVKEQIVAPIVEEIEPTIVEQPKFPVHLRVNSRTKCGKLCLAVSNLTDDPLAITCEKCLA